MGAESIPGSDPSSYGAGGLTPAQKDLVIRNLPVQVSVMDEHGIMVYWRGDAFVDCDPKYIGAHVNDAHNAGSRQMIADMEAAFRNGTRDEAVLRSIEDDRLMLLRYTPLRDDDGVYRGMMETMQDITDIVGMPREGSALDWH